MNAIGINLLFDRNKELKRTGSKDDIEVKMFKISRHNGSCRNNMLFSYYRVVAV